MTASRVTISRRADPKTKKPLSGADDRFEVACAACGWSTAQPRSLVQAKAQKAAHKCGL